MKTRLFIKPHLKWCFVCGLCVCVLAICIFLWIRHGSGKGDSRSVDKPIPQQFDSAGQIEFVDQKGNPKLYYVRLAGGGFDLFYADEPGLSDQSGTKLMPADTKKIRQEIATWVDQQASHKLELKQKQEREAANLAAQNAEHAQQLAEEIRREGNLIPSNETIDRLNTDASEITEKRTIPALGKRSFSLRMGYDIKPDLENSWARVEATYDGIPVAKGTNGYVDNVNTVTFTSSEPSDQIIKFRIARHIGAAK